MSDTPNLQLPYLAPGQAQKHATVNESLQRLDAVVQLSALSATTMAEPGSPGDGAVYILPAGKTGANWASFADWALGYYRDGAWEQLSPREGWLAFVQDTGQLLYCTGSAWSLFPAAKILTVSTTDRLLGRSTAGAGAAEEITLTAAGRALIDDASASVQRTTLGLGSAAIQNTGTSGTSVPLLDGANIWSGNQAFQSAASFQPQNLNYNTTNDAFAGYWITQKSRSGGPVQSGDSLGTFLFKGYDSGSVARNCATVGAFAEAAPGAGYVPASCTFVITTSAGAFVSRLKLYNDITVYSNVLPSADNSFTLGNGSSRMSTLYAATGAINTSDAREKTPLRAAVAAELRAVRRVMAGVGVFQWLHAVETKGQGLARLHFGVTAQAVEAAFAAEGLEAQRYALFCADPVFEEVEVAPERIEPAVAPVAELRDADGGLLRASLPGRPERHVPARSEMQPVCDAAGLQKVRLGVRHDQVFALALAALMTPEASLHEGKWSALSASESPLDGRNR